MNTDTPLRTYLDAPGVVPAKVAAELEIDRVTLWRWAASGVPAKRLSDAARITGIPAAVLRPDIAAHFASKPKRRATSPPQTERRAS